MIDRAFDLLLIGGMLGLAVQVVASRALFRSVVLFIALGLLMALAWARLAAPDLALAEAAIGAGLTGALLLSAYRALQPAGEAADPGPAALPRWGALAAAVLSGALVAALGWAALGLEAPAASAGREALARLGESGVKSPLTGVLLGFRAIDTLAEVVVLLVAFLGARVVAEPLGRAGPGPRPDPAGGEPVLMPLLLRVTVPMGVLVAGYLLWSGGHQPGGAFQAGAVLAALGVLLRLTGRLQPVAETSPAERLALVGGIVLFSAIGLAGAGMASAVLAYPEGWAYTLILLIETGLTLAIALPLTLLFSGSAGLRWRGR